METFTELKELAENPYFQAQRQKSLRNLSDDMIDTPIVNLINAFNKLPYCFTLQSCYGHFTCNGQEDPHNFTVLPVTDAIAKVEYRIAYIAFCIENGESGKDLLEDLQEITTIDPKNIQFGCADWFWKRQVNSYALQVEPDRYQHLDKAILDYNEALYLEKVRDEFFFQLNKFVGNTGKA